MNLYIKNLQILGGFSSFSYIEDGERLVFSQHDMLGKITGYSWVITADSDGYTATCGLREVRFTRKRPPMPGDFGYENPEFAGFRRFCVFFAKNRIVEKAGLQLSWKPLPEEDCKYSWSASLENGVLKIIDSDGRIHNLYVSETPESRLSQMTDEQIAYQLNCIWEFGEIPKYDARVVCGSIVVCRNNGAWHDGSEEDLGGRATFLGELSKTEAIRLLLNS